MAKISAARKRVHELEVEVARLTRELEKARATKATRK